METKLTLKMDQSIIQSVKLYADIHNRSVSRLVEDYFRSLILDSVSNKHYSPLVEELSGVIDENDIKDFSYVSYLEEKYE